MSKKRPAQKPRPPLPKSANSKYPIVGNYADFVKKEFENPFPPTKPPLQLIPHRKKPDMEMKASPYQNYYPKRHLKIVEQPHKPPPKRKGLLEQILSLPEKLPRLPYLSSSVSMQSVDTGNATTTEIAGKFELLNNPLNLGQLEKRWVSPETSSTQFFFSVNKLNFGTRGSFTFWPQ